MELVDEVGEVDFAFDACDWMVVDDADPKQDEVVGKEGNKASSKGSKRRLPQKPSTQSTSNKKPKTGAGITKKKNNAPGFGVTVLTDTAAAFSTESVKKKETKTTTGSVELTKKSVVKGMNALKAQGSPVSRPGTPQKYHGAVSTDQEKLIKSTSSPKSVGSASSIDAAKEKALSTKVKTVTAEHKEQSKVESSPSSSSEEKTNSTKSLKQSESNPDKMEKTLFPEPVKSVTKSAQEKENNSKKSVPPKTRIGTRSTNISKTDKIETVSSPQSNAKGKTTPVAKKSTPSKVTETKKSLEIGANKKTPTKMTSGDAKTLKVIKTEAGSSENAKKETRGQKRSAPETKTIIEVKKEAAPAAAKVKASNKSSTETEKKSISVAVSPALVKPMNVKSALVDGGKGKTENIKGAQKPSSKIEPTTKGAVKAPMKKEDHKPKDGQNSAIKQEDTAKIGGAKSNKQNISAHVKTEVSVKTESGEVVASKQDKEKAIETKQIKAGKSLSVPGSPAAIQDSLAELMGSGMEEISDEDIEDISDTELPDALATSPTKPVMRHKSLTPISSDQSDDELMDLGSVENIKAIKERSPSVQEIEGPVRKKARVDFQENSSQTEPQSHAHRWVQCRVQSGYPSTATQAGEEEEGDPLPDTPPDYNLPQQVFRMVAAFDSFKQRRVAGCGYGISMGPISLADLDKASFRDETLKKANNFNIAFPDRDNGVVELFFDDEEAFFSMMLQLRRTKIGSRHIVVTFCKDALILNYCKVTVVYDQNFSSTGFLSYYKAPFWSKPRTEETLSLHNAPEGIPIEFLKQILPDAIAVEDEDKKQTTKEGSRVLVSLNHKMGCDAIQSLFCKMYISNRPIFFNKGIVRSSDLPAMKEILLNRKKTAAIKYKEKRASARDINKDKGKKGDQQEAGQDGLFERTSLSVLYGRSGKSLTVSALSDVSDELSDISDTEMAADYLKDRGVVHTQPIKVKTSHRQPKYSTGGISSSRSSQVARSRSGSARSSRLKSPSARRRETPPKSVHRSESDRQREAFLEMFERKRRPPPRPKVRTPRACHQPGVTVPKHKSPEPAYRAAPLRGISGITADDLSSKEDKMIVMEKEKKKWMETISTDVEKDKQDEATRKEQKLPWYCHSSHARVVRLPSSRERRTRSPEAKGSFPIRSISPSERRVHHHRGERRRSLSPQMRRDKQGSRSYPIVITDERHDDLSSGMWLQRPPEDQKSKGHSMTHQTSSQQQYSSSASSGEQNRPGVDRQAVSKFVDQLLSLTKDSSSPAQSAEILCKFLPGLQEKVEEAKRAQPPKVPPLEKMSPADFTASVASIQRTVASLHQPSVAPIPPPVAPPIFNQVPLLLPQAAPTQVSQMEALAQQLATDIHRMGQWAAPPAPTPMVAQFAMPPPPHMAAMMNQPPPALVARPVQPLTQALRPPPAMPPRAKARQQPAQPASFTWAPRQNFF